MQFAHAMRIFHVVLIVSSVIPPLSSASAQDRNVVLPLDASDPRLASAPESDEPPVFENGDAGALQRDQFFVIITPEESVNFEADDPASSPYISDSVNATIFLRNSFNTVYANDGLYLHCVWEIVPNVSLPETASNFCDAVNEDAENLYPIVFPFSIGGRPCFLECDPADSTTCSCAALAAIVEGRIAVIQSGESQ